MAIVNPSVTIQWGSSHKLTILSIKWCSFILCFSLPCAESSWLWTFVTECNASCVGQFYQMWCQTSLKSMNYSEVDIWELCFNTDHTTCINFRGTPNVGRYSFDIGGKEISSVPDAVVIDPGKQNSVLAAVKVLYNISEFDKDTKHDSANYQCFTWAQYWYFLIKICSSINVIFSHFWFLLQSHKIICNQSEISIKKL